MYNNNYGNNLNGVNGLGNHLNQVQQEQQRQYLVNEFLKTDAGQEAYKAFNDAVQEANAVFTEAQKHWFNGTIAPTDAPPVVEPKKLNELESKIDSVASVVATLVEQLGGVMLMIDKLIHDLTIALMMHDNLMTEFQKQQMQGLKCSIAS